MLGTYLTGGIQMRLSFVKANAIRAHGVRFSLGGRLLKRKETTMKRLDAFKGRLQISASLVVMVAAIYTGSVGWLAAQDAKPKSDSKPAKATEAKPEKKKLSGAELYAIHCNRCHPERYATERTAAQWKTIMLHMRVRANLPAEQAKAILRYLQEDSGK